MSEFAPILIYLVMSPLVSLIPLGLPFLFASNSSTYPAEKLSAHECGSDPSGDARSRFDIRFYLVPILFIIPDPEVTFSSPWAVPPNKIDPFGSWSMMAFLILFVFRSQKAKTKSKIQEIGECCYSYSRSQYLFVWLFVLFLALYCFRFVFGCFGTLCCCVLDSTRDPYLSDDRRFHFLSQFL